MLLFTIGSVVLLIVGANLFIQLMPDHWTGVPSFKEKFSIEDLSVELANLSPNKLQTLSYDFAKLTKLLVTAKKHARGAKTSEALIGATQTLTKMLPSLNLDFSHLAQRNVLLTENICQEMSGFATNDCTYAKRLEKLITIVVVYDKSQSYDIVKLLNSVREYHSKIPIIIGANSSLLVQKIPSHFKNINKISNFYSKSNIGKVWNSLISKVKTKYTLIARDVIWFNKDARLDRLIRMVEKLDLSAAGGAFRDINGSWFQGCQQRVRRNFTIVYEAGYDESFEDCVFCDHVDGPFVVKTSEIQTLKFNEKILSQGLYEDLFLRLDAKESVVCPDAMFYTNITDRSYDPNDWDSFVTSWPTYKIKFSGREIAMPTPRTYPCDTGRGAALTPWCQKENADVTHAAFNVCASLNVTCEAESGTVMGAVKFNSVLPWERDADVDFVLANFTILANATRTWAKMGYKAKPRNNNYIALRSKNWRLEMWGTGPLTHYQPPTMLPMDLKRIRGPLNPGLYAKKVYGREIYQHAQHWGETGDKMKIYKEKRFLACHTPGNQDCLDRYNPDGNIQFKDPMP